MHSGRKWSCVCPKVDKKRANAVTDSYSHLHIGVSPRLGRCFQTPKQQCVSNSNFPLWLCLYSQCKRNCLFATPLMDGWMYEWMNRWVDGWVGGTMQHAKRSLPTWLPTVPILLWSVDFLLFWRLGLDSGRIEWHHVVAIPWVPSHVESDQFVLEMWGCTFSLWCYFY